MEFKKRRTATAAGQCALLREITVRCERVTKRTSAAYNCNPNSTLCSLRSLPPSY